MTDGLEAPSYDCALCGAHAWSRNASYDAKPALETDFGIKAYYRELWTCTGCGHVINHHGMDLSVLYQQDYWDKTYGDRVAATFEKIMSLPEGRSDNRGRVAAVDGYWEKKALPLGKELLDIGSGLAVFPAAMKKRGWKCTALDPDIRAVRHAVDTAGVEGLHGDFMKDRLDRSFALVTLNKVLEHVPDMAGMLRRVHDVLLPGGIVYVELPDGEGAMAAEGPDREEFYIEHYCAFSMASLALLAWKAGFRCDHLERVVEPSGKYTLRAFLQEAG